MTVDSLIYNRSQYFPRMIADQFNKSLIPTSGTIKAGTQVLKYGVATQDVTLKIYGFIRAGASIGGYNQSLFKVDEDSFLIRDSNATPINISNDGVSSSIQPVTLPVRLFTNVKWGDNDL